MGMGVNYLTACLLTWIGISDFSSCEVTARRVVVSPQGMIVMMMRIFATTAAIATATTSWVVGVGGGGCGGLDEIFDVNFERL